MRESISSEYVNEFMTLFRGRDDVYGVHTPETKRNKTSRKLLTEYQYTKHLEGGKNTLGIIPVIPVENSDSVSYFGCLDIDNHITPSDIDFTEIERRIHKNNLPLVLCQSKSGSAHCYIFFKDPKNTKELREILKSYAEIFKGVGEKDIEIFPKQDNIFYDEKDKVAGSYINIPYFNANKTNRYCIDNGTPRSLSEFINIAKSKIQTTTALKISESNYVGIPPCLNTLLNVGVTQGNRNNVLYNFAVYAKKRYGNDWEEEVYIYNHRVCENPLSEREISSIINSVSKKEYQYKCKEEPCLTYCNYKECAKQKYGISIKEESELALSVIPHLTNLKKMVMDPVKWEVDINGQTKTLTTDELYEFRKFKKILLEQCNILVAPLKHNDWLAILKPLVDNCENVEMPFEISPSGDLKEKLFMFFRRVDFNFSYKKSNDSLRDKEISKLPLTHGQPIVQLSRTGRATIYFRGADFIKFLRDNRLNTMTDKDVFYHLKKEGISYTTLQVNKTLAEGLKDSKGDHILRIRVWSYTLHKDDYSYIGAKYHRPELETSKVEPIEFQTPEEEDKVIDVKTIDFKPVVIDIESNNYNEPLEDGEDF